MAKLVYLVLVLLTPRLLGAQPASLPDIDIRGNLRQPLHFDPADSIRQSYTEIVLRPGPDGSYDTASLRRVRIAGGRTVAVETYTFLDAWERSRLEPQGQRIPSKIMSGTLSSFHFNESGLQTGREEYSVLPSNSVGLIDEHGKAWTSGQLAARADKAEMRARASRFLDSLLRHPPPPVRKLTDSVRMSYDDRGNPVTRFAYGKTAPASYAYRYDAAGRVVEQRIITRTHPSAAFTVAHFIDYDARGRIGGISSYSTAGDTAAAMRNEAWFRRGELRHYNPEGLPDTVVYREPGRTLTSVTAYMPSGRRSWVLLLDSGQLAAPADTVAFSRFSYNAAQQPDRFIEEYRFTKTSRSFLRRDMRYDPAGRLIAMEQFNWTGKGTPPERPVRQHLYFYGDASDAATAKLWHAAPARARPRVPLPPGAPAQAAPPLPAAVAAPPVDSYARSRGAIFKFVEQMPEFQGDLTAWLAAHLHYPADAKAQGIDGRVVVQFIVGRNGRIYDAQVVRGLNPSCDAEAVRLVRAMPDWKPGRQQGQPVDVYMDLPLNFRLE